MKLKYIKNGDYLLPNLSLNNYKNKNLNKYGLLKLDYLKKNNKVFYTKLLILNKLNSYLFSVGKEVEVRVDTLMNEYIKEDKLLTENLKETNQLKWAKLMNNYKNIAEEIVLKELIYRECKTICVNDLTMI